MSRHAQSSRASMRHAPLRQFSAASFPSSVASAEPPPPPASLLSAAFTASPAFRSSGWCPPVLVGPQPGSQPAQPERGSCAAFGLEAAADRRPASSGPCRSSRRLPGRPGSAQPLAASSAAGFVVPASHRPPSPRSMTGAVLAWGERTSAFTRAERPQRQQEQAEDDAEDDDSSAEAFECFTQPFFLFSQPAGRRAADPARFLTSALSSHPPLPTASSSALRCHRLRFLADNSFSRSYENVIGSGERTTYDTSSRQLGQQAVDAARADRGADQLCGKFAPLRRNGNELTDRILPHSLSRLYAR